MALYGFTRDDYVGEDVFWVFPENWTAVSIFSDLATQWRMGFSGPTGLDYGVIPTVLRLTGVERAKWPSVFAELQVMEDAALALFRQRKD